MHSITIGNNGLVFSYLDSGPPSRCSCYLTIFAIHGMGFLPAIFNKVMALSSKVNARFIAITRRGYPGSTPLSEGEVTASTSGKDDEKAAFVNARGLELALLLDHLIQQLDLHPISENGKNGGVAILGWSAGTTWTCSCIANMDQLPLEVRSRMASYIRAHIIQEPPSICLGLPLPPKIWSPLVDTTIPEDRRLLFYTSWITSYFDHGDLSSRDIDVISYNAPSWRRAPSIYNMSAEEIEEVVLDSAVTYERAFMLATQAQANTVYRKTCYSESVKKMLPRMKTSVLVGDATTSFPLNGTFSIQDDNDKEKGNIHFDIIRGMNHFMHWDDPEEALQAFLRAAL